MGTLLNNPIAWAHFKVRGGWKNHLWSTGGYIVLLTALIVVTTRLNPPGAMLLMWTNAILGLQLAVLVLYGCTVISNAIRRDITTGLLESHRLMPVSSGGAVFGYLAGPTFQALNLAAVNFAVGTTTATLGGTPIDKWLMANVIIALFVAFLWVGVAFASLVAKNAFGILFSLMISVTVGSGGGLVDLVPALQVLVTPLIGNSIFVTFLRGGPVALGYAWSFIAQFFFGTIFYLGAMRRFRRDDVPALGVTLGLLLLTAWIGTSAVGMMRWADFHPYGTMRGNLQPQNRGVPIIATLLAAMLLGLAPISAAARARADWMRTLLSSGRPPGHRPVSPLLVSLLATGISLLIVLAAKPRFVPLLSLIVPAGIVLLSFFVSNCYLLRIFYRTGQKAAMLLAAWVLMTWLIPIGIDAIRNARIIGIDRPFFSLFSPWGQLNDLFSFHPTEAVYGLVFQSLVALTLAIVFHLAEPNPRPRISAVPVQ